MKARVPFSQLWMHDIVYQSEVSAAFERVLKSGAFVLGNEVRAFESEFSAFLGTPGGVGVGSGTDAITLGLMGGEVGPGDEVLVPSFAPGATLTGVIASGATPVLVEVLPDGGMDMASLAQALTCRTKALVAVHLYGQMDSMGDISDFATAHGLWLLEDCAQAHGSRWRDKRTGHWRCAGTIGDVGAFSFYPTKNLGAPGDGGFVCTSSPDILERLGALRQYGWSERDHSMHIGRNSRMDEIQAAALRVALPHLGVWNDRRRKLAAAYESMLAAEAEEGRIQLPPKFSDRESVFHLFVIRVRERRRIIEELGSLGIGCGVHYPFALHEQPAYQHFGGGRDFSVSEHHARTVLSLPLYPSLTEAGVAEVVCAVQKAL
jgi:dTDP-4-amino-4,6-dideoxygalactose transaminase